MTWKKSKKLHSAFCGWYEWNNFMLFVSIVFLLMGVSSSNLRCEMDKSLEVMYLRINT
jgi:hypothetical protein